LKDTLMEILVVAYKDLKGFSRNRISLVFSLLMPIMLIAMFGYMMPSSTNSIHGVQVGFVNLDGGKDGLQVSDSIHRAVAGSSSFTLVDLSSVDQARSMVLDGTIKGAIIVPSNFTASLNMGKESNVELLLDPTNTVISGSISQAFGAVVAGVSDQYAAAYLSQSTSGVDSSFVLKPIGVSSVNVVQGGASYFDYVAPGFIGMGVMMSGLTAVGSALAHERELGTLDGMLMAPMKRVSIILGKTLALTFRNMLQGVLVIGLAVLIFGIHIRGDPFLIGSILLLGTVSFIGLGILATSIASDQESAQFILAFLQFPMMFLSGVFFPVEQMPLPLQYLSKVLPLTYANDALRKVMVLGVGLDGVAFQIALMVIIGAVTIAVGVPLFDRAVRK